MPKKLHIYSMAPIDFWQGWLTKDQYIAQIEDMSYGESKADAERRLNDLFDRAGRLATRAGWEGDVRQGPYFTALPTTDGESETVVAWKQDNNGSTFVASPYPMPWLDN